jgi:hypothetical protein
MSSFKNNEYIFEGIIKTDKYDYRLVIKTAQIIRNNEQIVYNRYFNFGSYISDKGEKKTCVDIYVMYPEFQNVIPNVNYKLANLITTHYNEKCSINEKLERSDGTRHMINTAMYFVSRMCPHIEGFEMNDASSRECDNKTTIVLSYFSITNYGKTWYEKNFEAYIEDIRNEKEKEENKPSRMSIYKEKVNSLINQKLPEWDIFKELYMRNLSKTVQNDIEQMHNKSITYGDLFKRIHKLGISSACIYLQPWIDKVMLPTGLRNFVMFTQWIIPIKSVKKISLVNYKKDFFGKK